MPIRQSGDVLLAEKFYGDGPSSALRNWMNRKMQQTMAFWKFIQTIPTEKALHMSHGTTPTNPSQKRIWKS